MKIRNTGTDPWLPYLYRVQELVEASQVDTWSALSLLFNTSMHLNVIGICSSVTSLIFLLAHPSADNV